MQQIAVQVVQVQMHVDAHVESLVQGEDIGSTEIGACANLDYESEDVAQSVLTPYERFKRFRARTPINFTSRGQR